MSDENPEVPVNIDFYGNFIPIFKNDILYTEMPNKTFVFSIEDSLEDAEEVARFSLTLYSTEGQELFNLLNELAIENIDERLLISLLIKSQHFEIQPNMQNEDLFIKRIVLNSSNSDSGNIFRITIGTKNKPEA